MIRRPPRPPIKMMQPIALDLANSVTLLLFCAEMLYIFDIKLINILLLKREKVSGAGLTTDII